MAQLLDEYPLLVMPSLAKQVGLNKAIFLQQLHYWLQKSKHEHKGRKWVYNSYPRWQEQFPFWSINTLKRTVTGLEKDGLVLVDNFNKMKADKTKWYTIDYTQLESTIDPKWVEHSARMGQPIPETTTKTTTDIVFTNVNTRETVVSPRDLFSF